MKKMSDTLIFIIILCCYGFALLLMVLFLNGKNQNEEYIQLELIAEGTGSWYNYDCRVVEEKAICKNEFCKGNVLKNEQCYSQLNQTCASRDIKRGTIILIENIDNGNLATCRVNDYVENPDVILDLSSATFQKLSPLSIGIINIRIYKWR